MTSGCDGMGRLGAGDGGTLFEGGRAPPRPGCSPLFSRLLYSPFIAFFSSHLCSSPPAPIPTHRRNFPAPIAPESLVMSQLISTFGGSRTRQPTPKVWAPDRARGGGVRPRWADECQMSGRDEVRERAGKPAWHNQISLFSACGLLGPRFRGW